MLLVLIVIFGALCVGGCIVLKKDDESWTGWGMTTIGGGGAIISIIALLCICVTLTLLKPIDAKISMYEEENTKIEQQIAVAIENYQRHEYETFISVSPDDSITLIALYPDLKSDQLVQSLIDVYIKNNMEIKTLREKELNGSIYRWWLYFGA